MERPFPLLHSHNWLSGPDLAMKIPVKRGACAVGCVYTYSEADPFLKKTLSAKFDQVSSIEREERD